MFHFKPSLIEASFTLGLPSIELQAQVYIKGSYGESLKDLGFLAKLNITHGKLHVNIFIISFYENKLWVTCGK
jgi:hypothetical protein